MDPEGKELVKYERRIMQRVAEHIEPWTYLKFPYLKNVGWKGFVDGVNSGCVYDRRRFRASTPRTGMATRAHRRNTNGSTPRWVASPFISGSPHIGRG